MSTIHVPSSTILYSDCEGHRPLKALGLLINENIFVVLNHKPGHAKP